MIGGNSNGDMLFVNGKKTQSGFLTMEILLAMTVAVFALAGAVLVAFGGQSLDIGTAQNSEALVLAKEMIADRQAAAADDFRLVNSTGTQTGIFTQKTEVSTHSFFTKKIIASVSWDFGGRRQNVTLQTLISDWRGTAGNDTCDSNLSGDWKNPQAEHFDFAVLSETASSTISGIDAYKNKLYVAVEDTSINTDPTLFIFNILDSKNLSLYQHSGNDIGKANALEADDDFIYLATKSSVNQLQIADRNGAFVSALELKDIDGDDCKKTGSSIFYKDNYVYLGLSEDDVCPELNIINVQNRDSPIIAGRFEVGAKINGIYVKGNYAYLATADSNRELIIIDITNPSAPTFVADYNLLPDRTKWGYGKTVKIIGDKIYFGRTYIDNSPEFYLFNHKESSVDLLGSYSDNGDPFSVNDIIIRDNLAFILAGSASQGGDLRILDIADPGNIVEEKIVGLPGEAGGRGGVAMDCEGNYLYVASVDGQGKSYLSVITAK